MLGDKIEFEFGGDSPENGVSFGSWVSGCNQIAGVSPVHVISQWIVAVNLESGKPGHFSKYTRPSSLNLSLQIRISTIAETPHRRRGCQTCRLGFLHALVIGCVLTNRPHHWWTRARSRSLDNVANSRQSTILYIYNTCQLTSQSVT